VPCEVALTAPHLLELALTLTQLAAVYLDTPQPYLYSTNAFWTRPVTGPTRPDIQELHRDRDDERFLAMFTYLSDVRATVDGPHELVGPDGQTRSIYGPAGTIFLADTSNEHRGLRPTRDERGIHWFRWSISAQPPAYGWDRTEPVSHRVLGRRYPHAAALRRTLAPLVSLPNGTS
jgi:hypothetical protein